MTTQLSPRRASARQHAPMRRSTTNTRRSSHKSLPQMEGGWNTDVVYALAAYDPLVDVSLRGHFQNKRVRRNLYDAGLVDRCGPSPQVAGGGGASLEGEGAVQCSC